MNDTSSAEEVNRLAHEGRAEDVPRLLLLLKGPHTSIRKTAAIALGRIGSGDALIVDALLSALTMDLVALVREQCARALAQLTPPATAAMHLLGIVAENGQELPFVRKACERAVQSIAARSSVLSEAQPKVNTGRRFKFDHDLLGREDVGYGANSASTGVQAVRTTFAEQVSSLACLERATALAWKCSAVPGFPHHH